MTIIKDIDVSWQAADVKTPQQTFLVTDDSLCDLSLLRTVLPCLEATVNIVPNSWDLAILL